jgi:hypothetical protein
VGWVNSKCAGDGAAPVGSLLEFFFIIVTTLLVDCQRERESAQRPECAQNSVKWRSAQQLPSPLGKNRISIIRLLVWVQASLSLRTQQSDAILA